MVSSTGMTWPVWAWVASLYCRQNSMMFTPCWPRAVPTGGAGVAIPALIWSFTTAWIFLRLLGAGAGLDTSSSPPAVHAASQGEASRHVPGVVVVDHLDQEVAGEDLALNHLALAGLDLHDVFHGDHDVEDLVLHLHGTDPGVEVGLHLVLVARVGVHDVPVAGAFEGRVRLGFLL